MIRVVDLFCGCGGLSLGFEQAGFKLQAGIDAWTEALEVYQKNFDHQAIQADLRNTAMCGELVKSFNPSVIIGGPPCQDFSSAGKQDENNGRGDLTISFAEIVNYVRPPFFVMENVPRIRGTQKLLMAKSIFSNAGYGLTEAVLNAALYGVPQRRNRFFLIGVLEEQDGSLAQSLSTKATSKEMTVREYMGNELDLEFYYRHPRSYARRGIFSIDEPSPTIRGVNRPLPDGYKLHKGDPVTSLNGIRALTTKERSRIQSFPKNYTFFGSKTNLEQMIGNAVPVALAKEVATTLMERITNSLPTFTIDPLFDL